LFQAQEMVMVQLGISIGEAMARMRAYAYAHDRRLSEVARDVVGPRLRFDPDPA
jgi:AmiR/NasT family two-component response regulator